MRFPVRMWAAVLSSSNLHVGSICVGAILVGGVSSVVQPSVFSRKRENNIPIGLFSPTSRDSFPYPPICLFPFNKFDKNTIFILNISKLSLFYYSFEFHCSFVLSFIRNYLSCSDSWSTFKTQTRRWRYLTEIRDVLICRGKAVIMPETKTYADLIVVIFLKSICNILISILFIVYSR